jgi:hypothetical protein
MGEDKREHTLKTDGGQSDGGGVCEGAGLGKDVVVAP